MGLCGTGLASLAALIGMVTSHGVGIVVFAGVLGFTNALTLTLALALPSMLSAPDDVHRTSAGMFTISYSSPWCCRSSAAGCGISPLCRWRASAGRAVRHRHCRLGVDGEECAAMTGETGRVS